MIINRIILTYFSPTGTSRKNARAFTAAMGIPFEEFDLTGLKERNNFNRSFTENELLVTGLPVYGGRLPKNNEPFFSGLNGDNTPTVVTVTYGNRAYDDTLIELKLRLEERGFVIKAGAAFIGEHSLNKDIAAGRPDSNDLMVAGKFGKMAITSIARDAQGSCHLVVVILLRPRAPAHHTGLLPRSFASNVGFVQRCVPGEPLIVEIMRISIQQNAFTVFGV